MVCLTSKSDLNEKNNTHVCSSVYYFPFRRVPWQCAIFYPQTLLKHLKSLHTPSARSLKGNLQEGFHHIVNHSRLLYHSVLLLWVFVFDKTHKIFKKWVKLEQKCISFAIQTIHVKVSPIQDSQIITEVQICQSCSKYGKIYVHPSTWVHLIKSLCPCWYGTSWEFIFLI